jgi:hypothetical protein
VPDPWALGAALAIGLSPPVLAYSTAVYPELAAAAALCGAALLALRLERDTRRRVGWSCFTLLAVLPWLETLYLAAALPIAVYAFRATRRARRPVLALTCVEILGFSVALYVGVSEGLYGGETPYAAGAPGEGATGASFPLGYVDRSYRLVALFVDRHYGLLRWAPIVAFAFWGAWIVWRERRSGLARAIPALRDEQLAGTLCAATAAAQLLIAAFLAPAMAGFWSPGRHLVAVLPIAVPLVAVALRRAPRVGALLALLGVAATVWISLDARLGGATLVTRLPDAPFGPLTRALPVFASGSAYPFVLAAALGVALTGLVVAAEIRPFERTTFRRRGSRRAA